MIGEYTADDIKFLYLHHRDVMRIWQTQISFEFDTVKNGEVAYDILKRVYADSLSGYENLGGWFGNGDKLDFYLGFHSGKIRDNVYWEYLEVLNAYGTNYGVSEEDKEKIKDQAAYDFKVDKKKKDDETKDGDDDWTTYIIIGVAAAAIIALLIPWKK